MRIRHGPARVEFHSHDQDETREYIRRNPADHSRVIRGKGRFLYRLSAVVAGRVIVGRTERWMHQTLRAAIRAVAQPLLGAKSALGSQRQDIVGVTGGRAVRTASLGRRPH